MKHTITLWATALLSLCACIAHAQSTAPLADKPNQAVIWRGFQHSWSYNHRLNRLGSYVAPQQDSGYVSVHTSATGVGADSTFFTENYTYIESPDVFFQASTQEFAMDTKEGSLVSQTAEVTIPADPNMRGKGKYIVILNGFDIVAKQRADKMALFHMHVEEATYAPEVNEIRFKLHISLVCACKSFECSKFNQKVMYRVQVHCLVIAGEEETLHADQATCYKDYLWGRRYEVYEIPQSRKIKGVPNDQFGTAALGIKSIDITLDQEHWLVEWNQAVTPLRYDPKTGEMEFSFNLFFKEWEYQMKKFSVFPTRSKFSSKTKGWASMGMEVVLLQFKNAKTTHMHRSGSLFWPGRNESAEVPKAMNSKLIKF